MKCVILPHNLLRFLLFRSLNTFLLFKLNAMIYMNMKQLVYFTKIKAPFEFHEKVDLLF